MTLNEILITVLIVSLLGTFAIATYVNVYEKSKGYNAVVVLRMIRTAERLYYLDWNNYVVLTPPCTSVLITEGYFQCPNLGSPQDRGFNYSVTTVGASYTATATRLGTGRYAGNTITLHVTCCPEIPAWGGSWPADWRPN